VSRSLAGWRRRCAGRPRPGRGVRGLATSAVLLLLTAGACRTPPPPPVRDDSQAVARVESLRGEARARRAMRAHARMAVDADHGSLRANYLLVLERPARLRVEIRGMLGETLGVLVTDGATYDLFRSDDHTRESGRVYPTLLWDVARIPLTATEAVDLLLGAPVPPPGYVLRDSGVARDGSVTAEYATHDGGAVQHFGFDGEGRLRSVEAVASAGSERETLWDARFAGYDAVDGTAFAHEVDLRFPGLDTQARVRLRDVELNPDLTPDVFVLKVPEG